MSEGKLKLISDILDLISLKAWSRSAFSLKKIITLEVPTELLEEIKSTFLIERIDFSIKLVMFFSIYSALEPLYWDVTTISGGSTSGTPLIDSLKKDVAPTSSIIKLKTVANTGLLMHISDINIFLARYFNFSPIV